METVEIAFLLALALPLVCSPFVALAGRLLGRRVGWVALVFPALSTISLLVIAARVDLPNPQVIHWPWIPSLGINLSFLVDGLSLFFGLVVSGMGCLIFFYAIEYLDDRFEHHARFYCYLVLFMAAMLGTVFANNLLVLFVFWELTGLASFLLIGFLHGEESSRTGARQALLVTNLTGLAMLAGIIMVYVVTGTYDFSRIAVSGLPDGTDDRWLSVALVLIVLGAFGKSAQFPLHFWLPNAMAAPTPVSAYLHSATMVKLGVFLCARIFPLFSDHEYWKPLLSVIPFTTMLLGAILALLSHRLKAILAFSTVSQLGFLIGYYGLGPVDGVEYDYLHILNHVLYKGSLFMSVGILAHAAGVYDIRDCSGLFRRLPLLGATMLVSTATMAGLPGTTGFLSKEMMFTEIFDAMPTHAALGWYAAACVILASVIKVAFSVRLFANIFLGKEMLKTEVRFHRPSRRMQLPPVLLAICALVFGLWPGLLERPFQLLAVEGLNRPEKLMLWHGFSRELFLSSAVVLIGFALYWLGERACGRWHAIPRALQFDHFFELGVERFSRFTRRLTTGLYSDQPLAYLPIIIGFSTLLVSVPLVLEFAFVVEWNSLPEISPDPLRSFVAALIALAVIGVVLPKRWTTQVIALSVAGFLICFYFVLYRAPDLALTQILVEVVTLFMILILLGRFPRSAQIGEATHRAPLWRKILNAAIALAVGTMVTMFILVVTRAPHQEPLGEFFLENTLPLAAGGNAVNTILVDFRGFDTLGEITVLIVATLGGLGLLMRYKRSETEYKQGPMGPPGFGIDENAKDSK